MRIGFEVILKTDGKAEFHLFPSQQFPKNSLITFAQDSTTGIEVALMGRIYYQDDLKNHFSEAFQQDLASDAALVLAIFRHAGTKGLEQLEGEFALVIFDPEQQCLVTMRDPLGSWPLYWTNDGQTLR
ncbi:MAG: asparagine synthase, partial [Waterburya sp.]